MGFEWPTFAPADPKRLAELITTLMSNEGSRAELSRKGQDVIRSRYSWNGVLEAYTTALSQATLR